MLPKGKRRQTVKADYRVARTAATEAAEKAREAELAALFGTVASPATSEPDAPGTAAANEQHVSSVYGPDRKTKASSRANRSASSRSSSRLSSRSEAEDLDPASKLLDDITAADDDLIVPSPEAVVAADGTRTRTLIADAASRGLRLDQFLARALPEISRARAQLLIEHGQVQVDGATPKSKHKLHGGETVIVQGDPQPSPLRAVAEDIPLDVVFEDKHLAVINKPAGMMVHAGSGLSEDARSRGTLVNALLHHFRDQLSAVGGPLRPGIVHRLDKQTSGLILVAKNDAAHRSLAQMFSDRSLEKRYIALVHRDVAQDRGTVLLPIARDRIRRTRMTTRTPNLYMTTASHGSEGLRHPNEPEPKIERRAFDARPATTHYTVLERLHTAAGDFTLLDVHIETGRTHQIRVHMQALGHPVVGDTLYGAPARIAGLEPPEEGAKPHASAQADKDAAPTLTRNFLHAAHLALPHPISGKALEIDAPLPMELQTLLSRLRALAVPAPRR